MDWSRQLPQGKDDCGRWLPIAERHGQLLRGRLGQISAEARSAIPRTLNCPIVAGFFSSSGSSSIPASYVGGPEAAKRFGEEAAGGVTGRCRWAVFSEGPVFETGVFASRGGVSVQNQGSERGFLPDPSKRYIRELTRSVLMRPNQPTRDSDTC